MTSCPRGRGARSGHSPAAILAYIHHRFDVLLLKLHLLAPAGLFSTSSPRTFGWRARRERGAIIMSEAKTMRSRDTVPPPPASLVTQGDKRAKVYGAVINKRGCRLVSTWADNGRAVMVIRQAGETGSEKLAPQHKFIILPNEKCISMPTGKQHQHIYLNEIIHTGASV